MKAHRLAIFASLQTCMIVFSCKSPAGKSTETSAELTAQPADNPKLTEDLNYIKSEAGEMVQKSAEKLGKPANRDFHSKGMCAKATFTVKAQDIPGGLRVGLFAQDGVYPMYGRFSNGRPGRDANDQNGSVFGFAVKLIGVPGNKFDMQSLGSSKPINSNQDWNMATGQTFAIPNAAIYREQRESGASTAATAAFAIRHPIITSALLGSLTNIDSFTAASYHTQVALHYGEDHIAKFSVAPCDNIETKITSSEARKRDSDYLRKDLTRRITTSGACFVFRAQVRQADHKLTAINADWAKKYPSDNPTVVWPEGVMPYITLAKIEFPKQPKLLALQPTCEALSFNPGNALQDFRPIETDTLMRARFLSAYEGSVTTRTSLNRIAQSEPAPISDVAGWIRE